MPKGVSPTIAEQWESSPAKGASRFFEIALLSCPGPALVRYQPDSEGSRPMSIRPLAIAERQFAAWLGDVERSVVLPLKWSLLFFCLAYWSWARGWELPSPAAFGLFIFFAGATAGEQYFFARDRITPRQVRPFVFGSFLLDAIFISALVVIDIYDADTAAASVVSDFFVLFILLVLRGIALFRTRTENLLGFGAASALFAAAASIQIQQAELLVFPRAVNRLVLIWGVMLFVQAFISLLNVQKEEQIRAAEQMVRSASLASLGELSAGVAHEIRNPVSIIKTYADYLEKSVGADDPHREDFETIRKEAQRCEEIVRRMLDFANPQVQGFTAVNVEELVRETIAFVFHEAREERIDVNVVSAGRIPAISGDAVQLKQALLNILFNAREILSTYMEEKRNVEGRIDVALLRGAGPRPPVRIEIRDNGPGISEEDAERLFEPFFTKRARGTGLGLAITRRIIEAHNGTIKIAAHPEGGTAVTIDLPIEGEEEA